MSEFKLRVKKISNVIAHFLLRYFDAEAIKNETLIIILLGFAMYGLFFFEVLVPSGAVFDSRLHWIPEVFIFFFAARVFKSKKALFVVFTANWTWLTYDRIHRFDELAYPHYYEMLGLYVTFVVLGHLSRRRIPTERFERFRVELNE